MCDSISGSKLSEPTTDLVSLFDVESLDANLFRYADLGRLWGKRGAQHVWMNYVPLTDWW